ncbi:DUF1655 domain-containing protein [Geobacillus stearothermophilus]|uniref:DUF1655 domain-containing protein n=1 Tax=Geobacillus stearothermophilus TaxID=1422 RepID=UPI0030C9DAD0
MSLLTFYRKGALFSIPFGFYWIINTPDIRILLKTLLIVLTKKGAYYIRCNEEVYHILDGKAVCPFSTVAGKPQTSPSRLGVTEDRTTSCFTDSYMCL